MKKALFSIIAVVLAGCFLLLAVGRFKSYDRCVSVRGLCEREVAADLAIYPLSFSVTGDDPAAIYADISNKNQTVVAFLKENGFEDSEITVASPKVTDRYAEGYSNYNDRYSVRSTVSVYTNKVDKVQAITEKQSELLEKGIAVYSGDWNNPTVYEFTALNDIKPEMIEEANKNARAAAEQFAKDSHSRLGKIKDAQQGLFSIEDRDSYTPSVKKVRVVTYVTYYLR